MATIPHGAHMILALFLAGCGLLDGLSDHPTCADHVTGADAYYQGARWDWTLTCGEATVSGQYEVGPARLTDAYPCVPGDADSCAGCVPSVYGSCDAREDGILADVSVRDGAAPLAAQYFSLCGGIGAGAVDVFLARPDGKPGTLRCTEPVTGSGKGACFGVRQDGGFESQVSDCTYTVSKVTN